MVLADEVRDLGALWQW